MPFEQPTRCNLKTARLLNLTIPPALHSITSSALASKR
jgi:hypothetical protein